MNNQVRRHSLTFEGDVPEDEMQRAAFLAHPKIQEARAALEAAFIDAGHPHVATSRTIKTKAAAAPKPASTRPAAQAAE
jgi:hypothetical protein